jgi:hypothetical protein
MQAKPEISDEELLKRLHKQPALRTRLVQLLETAEDSAGDLRLADDAEDRIVEQMRQMSLELMQAWADNQVQRSEQQVRRSGRAHREGKKTLLAHSIRRGGGDGAAIPQWQAAHTAICPECAGERAQMLAAAATGGNGLWGGRAICARDG